MRDQRGRSSLKTCQEVEILEPRGVRRRRAWSALSTAGWEHPGRAFCQAEILLPPPRTLLLQEMEKVSVRWRRVPAPCTLSYGVWQGQGGGGWGQCSLTCWRQGGPRSREHKLSEKETGCSVKCWHRLPAWKPLVVRTVVMQMQAGRLWPPSVKHLIVARLPHPGHHVDEEPAKGKQLGHPGLEHLGKRWGGFVIL